MLKTNTGIRHPKPKTCPDPETSSGFSGVLRRKNIRKLINNVILKLDKEDYDILYELYFKNTSIHQLARNIGVSRATVRWRRDKALKRVKEVILNQTKK